jgi:hypothetical protein
VAMRGTEDQRTQDQHVQRSLKDVAGPGNLVTGNGFADHGCVHHSNVYGWYDTPLECLWEALYRPPTRRTLAPPRPARGHRHTVSMFRSRWKFQEDRADDWRPIACHRFRRSVQVWVATILHSNAYGKRLDRPPGVCILAAFQDSPFIRQLESCDPFVGYVLFIWFMLTHILLLSSIYATFLS